MRGRTPILSARQAAAWVLRLQVARLGLHPAGRAGGRQSPGLIGFSRCLSPTSHRLICRGVFPDDHLIRGSGHYVLGRDPWQLVAAQLLMPLAFA